MYHSLSRYRNAVGPWIIMVLTIATTVKVQKRDIESLLIEHVFVCFYEDGTQGLTNGKDVLHC